MHYCIKCGVENEDKSTFCLSCGSRLKEILSSADRPRTIIPAGFWKRFAAGMIDMILIIVLIVMLQRLFFTLIYNPIFIYNPMKEAAASDDFDTLLKHMTMKWDRLLMMQKISKILDCTLFILFGWLYFTGLESSLMKATFGKIALGIIVTDLDGNRISFGRANGRYWCKYISALILMIGYIMAGFTEKKQALHDTMANTLVVKKQLKSTLYDQSFDIK